MFLITGTCGDGSSLQSLLDMDSEALARRRPSPQSRGGGGDAPRDDSTDAERLCDDLSRLWDDRLPLASGALYLVRALSLCFASVMCGGCTGAAGRILALSAHHSTCRSKARTPNARLQCGHFCRSAAGFMTVVLTDCGFAFGAALAVFGGLFSKNGLFSGNPKFFGKYCSKSVPSRLCREESNVFLFLAAVFSHILTCLASDSGTKVLPHTAQGISLTGPEGSGATGAMGRVGTGGDGGGPTRAGGGVRGIGRKDSTLLGVFGVGGSGVTEREDFEEWCRLPFFEPNIALSVDIVLFFIFPICYNTALITQATVIDIGSQQTEIHPTPRPRVFQSDGFAPFAALISVVLK